MILSISTANYVEGLYDELLKRGTAVLNGTSKETRLAPFIYQIDDVNKWNEINELQKSMPNLGVSVSVDYMLEEIAIAEGSLSKKAEFLTKYCNIKQNSSVAWLDAQTIEKCVNKPLRLEDFKDCYAVMGIDLSRTTDLSCAVLLIEKNGIINTFARFYLPANKIEEATARDGLPYKAFIQRGFLYPSGENFIDYQDIFSWCRELIEKYKIYVLQVGYDRYSAQYLVSDLKNYGFHTDDVYQGTNLSGIIRLTEGYMKDGKINIGDNDLLKAHFYNSALKMNTENERCQLVKVEPRCHIDGMAAMLDAMCMRDKYWNEIGRQLSNERRS
jgi:phage terminase large subunit-like protein